MHDTTTFVFKSNEKFVSNTWTEKIKFFRTEVPNSLTEWIIWKIRIHLRGTTIPPSAQHCHRTDAPWA
jgi:hypothetical protein